MVPIHAQWLWNRAVSKSYPMPTMLAFNAISSYFVIGQRFETATCAGPLFHVRVSRAP
jgi:hypothetical protein